MNNCFALNDEQKKAAEHFAGPCLVLAGPGTGKTTIIVNRIINLIKKYKVSPDSILVVTFTKAAAEEMRIRFSGLEGYRKEYNQVTFGTFHSVFFKILKQYKNYKIENLITDNEKNSTIKSIVKNLGYDFFEDEQSLEDLINELAYIENMLISEKEYNPYSCAYDEFWTIYGLYKKYKKQANKFDFEDMISHCYKLLLNDDEVLQNLRMKNKFILIDEFQDINKAQLSTISLIAKPLNNLFIVGDDDQSIYKFRGSDPKAMLEFSKVNKDVKVITLKKNYRSNKSILSSALNVINNNIDRYEKDLITVNDSGGIPHIVRVEDNEREAESVVKKIKELCNGGLSYSEIGVLYRTRIQSRAIIDCFTDNKIPYTCSDGLTSVYNHWIYNDIISYFKASQNIDRNNSIYRIVNKPYRRISRMAVADAMRHKTDILQGLMNHDSITNQRALKRLEADLNNLRTMKPGRGVSYIRKHIGYEKYIRQWTDLKNTKVKPLIEIMDDIGLSAGNFVSITEYLDHIRSIMDDRTDSIENRKKVKIMTMHKAKGLEFGAVFIIGAVDGLAPYILNDECDKDLLEEERRLFYVSMTRAKDELYIYVPKYRYGKRMKQSRFLDEMYGIC